MKIKILLTLAAVVVMAMALASSAFTGRSVSTRTAMSCCCCSGDSCPMKKKDASAKETASCYDNCDCCKGEGSCTGDSCPMKKKGDSADKAKETPSGEAKGCCCSCCNKDKAKEKRDGPSV